jgi:hypothetical protein
MEKIIDKNELLNQLILKLNENKIFLNSEGIMFETNLDNIRIMENSVSITFPTIYLKLDIIRNEFELYDMINNEVYVYRTNQDELKIKVTPNLTYIKTKIEEVKPISREALLRLLEALKIPYGKRSEIRFDIDINNYREIEYTNDNGLILRYGLSEIEIKRDKIIVDGLNVNISNYGYYISFEKGIMSILF